MWEVIWEKKIFEFSPPSGQKVKISISSFLVILMENIDIFKRTLDLSASLSQISNSDKT